MAAAHHHDERWPLGALLEGILAPAPAWAALAVAGLTLDSRAVVSGGLFLALAGTRRHGLEFAGEAVKRGAAAVLYEPEGAVEPASAAVPMVPVPDLRRHVGTLAARFYGEPSCRMWVAGVTGTNGKTSVTQFIAQALTRSSVCGVIGTLGAGVYPRAAFARGYPPLERSGRTTPDAVTLQATLAHQLEAGARHVAIEVSSHALDQGRVGGVAFDVAVFTNLSHEHLDYHGDMAAYEAAKARLFSMPDLRAAVINLDDPGGRRLAGQLPAGVELIGFSRSGAADAAIRGAELRLTGDGLAMTVESSWGAGRVQTGLLGRFNAENVLAALGALLAAGLAFDDALERLGALQTVPGRMERLGGGDRPTVVVDYAHTADALEQVLDALREHCRGKLWCVFGCGGERDRAKRPVMGAVAERLADCVVLTDDNPRGEDAFGIIEAIQQGMNDPDAAYVLRDRGAAIRHAIELSGPEDIVLVAGKGHETEQEVDGHCHAFSDRNEALAALGEARD